MLYKEFLLAFSRWVVLDTASLPIGIFVPDTQSLQPSAMCARMWDDRVLCAACLARDGPEPHCRNTPSQAQSYWLPTTVAVSASLWGVGPTAVSACQLCLANLPAIEPEQHVGEFAGT